MIESDFGKKTTAAETGKHHGKQHRTSFGKTTSRRTSHLRTRASHSPKNRHQKGTTFMKRKASATALVLFIATLVFATGVVTKAATFTTGDTLGGNVTFICATSGLVTTGSGTPFTITETYTNTVGGPTLATVKSNQTTLSSGWETTTPLKQKWVNTTMFDGGTAFTSTSDTGGVTGRFTIPQDTDASFNFNDTSKFFDETNPNFDQFF